MSNGQQVFVVLLGPRQAGTTSLLAASLQTIFRGGHGFPADSVFGLAELQERSKGAHPLSALHADWRPGPMQASALTAVLTDYQVMLSKAAALPKLFEGMRPVMIERTVTITDVPGVALEASAPSELRSALLDRLRAADALILVWPIDRVTDRNSNADPSVGWATALASLVAGSKAAVAPRLHRIVVAFTFLDRELALAYYDAGRLALDAEASCDAIGTCLARNAALRHALVHSMRWSVSLHLITVSSFGLIRGYGETSWLPGMSSPLLDGKGGGLLAQVLGQAGRSARRAALPAEVDELWLPIRAADPLLSAVFGVRHPLMLGLDDVLGRRDALLQAEAP